jgi:DNA-binding XRE family transcriptional regulator
MADLKYQPIAHKHKDFLAKAQERAGFTEAYEALELEYALAGQMIKARAKAGLTQDAVAERMGTTKSAISRLEATGKHAPSLTTLKKYAAAVGCDLQVKLIPHKVT